MHPRPGVLESMSSWLSRLADMNGAAVKDLIGDLDLVEVPQDVDIDQPTVMLDALTERTGVPSATLKAMTLSGWVPWLFDDLHPQRGDRQETFDTYVRANSVLLAPGEAGTHRVDHLRGWLSPWRTDVDNPDRACPVCADDPDRGTALVWRLPLMIGCAEHGCYLEDAVDVRWSTPQRPVVPRPVPEPLATLERYTYAALVTGRVDLPGRPVHAGVWFRLLRSLLDEVTVSYSGSHAHTRHLLEKVWAGAGQPARGGLTTWHPYELLNSQTRETMLLAAATALQLAADQKITARGRLASAIQPPAARHVSNADPRPDRNAGHNTLADTADAILAAARTNPDEARTLLAFLTSPCRTRARFDEQRDSMITIGIPATFLPTAAELGRTDLT